MRCKRDGTGPGHKRHLPPLRLLLIISVIMIPCSAKKMQIANTPYSKMAANELFFCLHVN